MSDEHEHEWHFIDEYGFCPCGLVMDHITGDTGRIVWDSSTDELDWTVVQDPAFYKGLFQRWKSEVHFQAAKVTRLKQRLEDVRDLLRGLERVDYADAALREQLHRAVFG